jgi:predicted MFS family arabinose efflux permease
MGCYGALLFTLALHLQYALHESALRAGLTFAFYAAGFAAASTTWSRLPERWHPRVPAAGSALFALATAALVWTTTRDSGWPWQATALLVLSGAGHGAGFGSLVRRTVENTPPEHATAIGGLLSTVTQLAIVVGVSALGSLYAATPADATLPPLARVLTVSALATALTAAALTRVSAQPASP